MHQHSQPTTVVRAARKAVAAVVAALGLCLAALVVVGPPAQAATGDIGFADQGFSGVTNPPTSDKPQSKLWFNDGSWWAVMFSSSSLTWHIYRLDRTTHTWSDTGTQVDNRPQSLSDALWDGSKLYIGSQYASVSSDSTIKPSVSGRPARLYRYSYDSAAKKYTLDSGFPTNINNFSSESLTIDKDSNGKIWATWTQVSGSSTTGYTSKVYVNVSTGGTGWGTPFVLPVSGSSVAPDDISAVVAFQRSKIGVMWSNHNDDTMYWAVHNDGAPTTSWQGSVALRGNKQADDHINLKTIQADAAGRVFAAVKTSLDQAPSPSPSDPQIKLLVFKPGTGSWSTTVVGTLADCHTRPIVMLDEQNSKVYVFATAPTASGCAYSGAPGTVYMKSAPLDNPVFASGRGTPVIRDAASANMNNATSSKQSVTGTTGLVVLASNFSTKKYWHSEMSLGSTAAAPTASFTASPSSGTAPLTVRLTDTSTGSPTSWSWDLGNGTKSTAQNPSVTYDTAGTYTVTLTASNAAGSSAPVSKDITVTTGGGSGGSGVARAGTSTATATTADTGLTVAAPSGTAAGDVLVSCLALNGGSVSAAPAGWTRFAAATGVSNPHVYGYYKVAGSSEPASYRWTFGSSVTSGGGIARYTGATGVDGTASTASGASAASGTVPGVTTTTTGAMLAGCMGINSGSTAVTITAPSGMSQAWDVGGKRNEYADAVLGAAGGSGARTWQFSSAREWAGWLVALRPG